MLEGNEFIPYTVTFEGKIDPSRLPELLALLGEIGTEQHISYSVGEQPLEEATLSKREFQAVWNNIGGSQTWGCITRAAQEIEDFPLRYEVDEKTETPLLKGDLPGAIKWLRQKPLKGNGSASAVTILERIARQDPEYPTAQ